MESGFDHHHLSENLTPRQYLLAKLLGDYYGYRLQNEIMPQLEDDLVELLKGHKINEENAGSSNS